MYKESDTYLSPDGFPTGVGGHRAQLHELGGVRLGAGVLLGRVVGQRDLNRSNV